MGWTSRASSILYGDPPPRIVLLTAALHEDELIEALHLRRRGIRFKRDGDQAPGPSASGASTPAVSGSEKDAAGARDGETGAPRSQGGEIASAAHPARRSRWFGWLRRGTPTKQISSELFIAEGTVKIHLHNIYEKLKINRRADLVRIADEYGLK